MEMEVGVGVGVDVEVGVGGDGSRRQSCVKTGEGKEKEKKEEEKKRRGRDSSCMATPLLGKWKDKIRVIERRPTHGASVEDVIHEWCQFKQRSIFTLPSSSPFDLPRSIVIDHPPMPMVLCHFPFYIKRHGILQHHKETATNKASAPASL